jgi:hypothetical protein
MSEIWSIDGRITEREKLKYSIAKRLPVPHWQQQI